MEPSPPHDGTSTDPDLQLVRQAQAGDTTAFDQLVLRHQSEMTALLFRFTNDRDDLEDMVQATFVRAWRALGAWQPEKPFRHWLKRIATRVGLEFCRREKNSPLRHRPSQNPHPEADTDPLDQLPAHDLQHTNEAAAEVRYLLSLLPPDDRALLTLLHLEEMPVDEIAGHFGWSRANTRIKAFRARLRIRQLLKKHGYSS